MKVCIIGDFSSTLDEGLKNIANHLADNLSKDRDIQLLKINVKNIPYSVNLRKIKNFHPAIVHYVPGPTNKSLLLLKFIKAYLRCKPKIVLSAPHPKFSDKTLKLLQFKPDFMFASSKNFLERLEKLKISSRLVPNGVDLRTFLPSSNYDRMRLREKYSLKKDSFTVLHVGHLISNRNLDIFIKLAKAYQVVLVTSTYIKTDYRLLEKMRNAGCIIFQGYFPNIEEFYQLSDCYVFPVKKGNTILCPLSVMEAMSCNLPVVTTDFEGLTTFFPEGDGLLFAKEEHEFIEGIESIEKGDTSIATREKVDQYSWEDITLEIIKTYRL